MYSENLKEQFLGFYFTPSLFTTKIDGLEQFEFDDIDLSLIDFNKLQINEKIPLGKRVERFFEFYILNSKRYALILKNIQIIKDKNTIGEIDFILFDNKNEEFIHLELVYKFYIYNNSFKNELDKYIGPNRNDTLIRKLHKLKNYQLPLLYKNETKSYLEKIDLNNIKQKICFKGNLFFNDKEYKQEIKILNNSSKKGFYLKYDNFIKENKYKNYEYYLPHRFDWLSSCNNVKNWTSFSEIITEINEYINIKRSPLLWVKKNDRIEQFFILYY